MDGNLKRFLVDTCSDILHGDYKERAQEFVELAKKNSELENLAKRIDVLEYGSKQFTSLLHIVQICNVISY